jgi:NADH-quinone oxidoreductase subunit J
MEYLTLLFSQTVNVLLVVINFMTIQFTLSLLLSDSLLRKIMALISIFICYMMLLLLLHAEFLAFVLIILYVGAIAVLFLFVVMLINLTKIYSTLLTIYQKIAMLYLPCILIFLFYFLVQHKKTSMSFFINI